MPPSRVACFVPLLVTHHSAFFLARRLVDETLHSAVIKKKKNNGADGYDPAADGTADARRARGLFLA